MSVSKVIRYPRKNDQYTRSIDQKTGIETDTVLVWYKVLFDSADIITWTEYDATRATDGITTIPQPGDAYIGDTSCVFRGAMAMRSPDGPWVAEVQVTFSNQSSAGSGKSNADITIDPVEVSVDAYRDASGDALVNVLNEWYDPLPKQIYDDFSIEISFTTSTLDVTNIAACRNRSNNASLTLSVNGVGFVCAQNTLKFKAPRLSTVPSGAPPYEWKVVYVLMYRGDTWLDVIQNRSYYCYDPTSGAKVRILNPNGGGYAATPQLIDWSGHVLAPDDQPTLLVDPVTGAPGNGGLVGLTMVTQCDMSGLLSDLIE